MQENMDYKCQESDQTDIYYDRGSGIGFWHDFPHNVPLEKSYDGIKKKYERRIERLFAEIERSKDILLFRVSTVRPGSGVDINNIVYAKEVVDDKILEAQFRQIQALFPDKHLSLLEVSLFNEPHRFRRWQPAADIIRIEAFSDIKYEWQGDPALFEEILRDFRLKPSVMLRNGLHNLLFKLRRRLINIGAALGIEKYKQNKRRLKNRFNR